VMKPRVKFRLKADLIIELTELTCLATNLQLGE
jgi:hypothetical protein